MSPENTEKLLAAMRLAVIAGRMMRARQNAYFQKRTQPQLIAARQAEQNFDEKSLAAVRLEEELKRQEEP